MTMLELQKLLGETIQGVVDDTVAKEKAVAVASLAKQMINNADVTLRTDKYVGNGGVRADKMIGNYDERS